MHLSTEDVDLKGYKAIIPAVSFGNAGQLALDLLISTVNARKIGSIWHEGVLPLVGGDAFDSKSLNLTISTELFACESKKCLLIQIRSPILKHLENDFKDKLIEWMTKVGIEHVIILASALNLKKYKSVIEDPVNFRYILGTLCDPILTEQLKELECIEAGTDEVDDVKDGQGTRFAMNLMSHCDKVALPCVFILKYSAEGDNRAHAVAYGCLIDNIFQLIPPSGGSEKRFIVPPSWDLMYGNVNPRELY